MTRRGGPATESVLFPGELNGLRPLPVVQRAIPALDLRTARGDQDRGGLPEDLEAIPRLEAAVPEHRERDPVAGHEVVRLVVVGLGPEADDREIPLVISSELLEARGFPGALPSIGGVEPEEDRPLGRDHCPEVDVLAGADIRYHGVGHLVGSGGPGAGRRGGARGRGCGSRRVPASWSRWPSAPATKPPTSWTATRPGLLRRHSRKGRAGRRRRLHRGGDGRAGGGGARRHGRRRVGRCDGGRRRRCRHLRHRRNRRRPGQLRARRRRCMGTTLARTDTGIRGRENPVRALRSHWQSAGVRCPNWRSSVPPGGTGTPVGAAHGDPQFPGVPEFQALELRNAGWRPAPNSVPGSNMS